MISKFYRKSTHFKIFLNWNIVNLIEVLIFKLSCFVEMADIAKNSIPITQDGHPFSYWLYCFTWLQLLFVVLPLGLGILFVYNYMKRAVVSGEHFFQIRTFVIPSEEHFLLLGEKKNQNDIY